MLVLPVPLALAAAVAATTVVSKDRTVTLQAPLNLQQTHPFGGFSLMPAGWRLRWDGQRPGPGIEIAQYSISARPTTGSGVVTELVQVGSSRDASVVATCGTAGLKSDVARRLPNRMLGGHRWTVYRGSDAGMSQNIAATNWRTVVDGACYAIDRATYGVSAVDPLPKTAPTQVAAAARIDRILVSIRVGVTRHAG